MNKTNRYLALCLIGFLPELSGCLQQFHLKADIEADTVTESEEESSDEVEAHADNPET